MNTLTQIRNPAGEITGYHLAGLTDKQIPINSDYSLFALSIGEFAEGLATMTFNVIYSADSFTFTPAAHADDPEGQAGFVNYTRIKNLLKHTTHAHGDPAPVIDDPLEARIALLEAKLNAQVKVFDTAQLKVFRDENNKVIGHEFILSMTDASETLIAINTNFQSIEKQGADEPPHLVLRYYDDEYKIAGEVRAIIATNDFAGYRFILNGGGIGTTYTGATAYNELLVAESVNNDNN